MSYRIVMRQSKDYPEMELVVRTALPPDSLAAGIRTALSGQSIPISRSADFKHFRIWSTKPCRHGDFW
jgi:hypothetical protein